MELSLFILGLLTLIIILHFWLKINDSQNIGLHSSINFPLFFFLGWIAYCGLYLIEIILKNTITETDKFFLIDAIIAVISLIIGAYIYKTHKKKNHIYDLNQIPNKIFYLSKSRFYFISFLMFIILHFFIVQVYGSWIVFFTQSYGNFLVTGINSFTSAIPLVIVSFILIFNSHYIILSRSNVLICRVLSIIFILVFMFGGNRNLGLMMITAFIFARFQGAKINLILIVFVLIIAIPFFSVVAIGRMYGFINFISGDIYISNSVIWDYIFSISQGELGTMVKVSEYYNLLNIDRKLEMGYSYFIQPFINLIPTFIYSERPATISVDFTRQYWGATGFESQLIGLGFSPIVEAKMNFGFFWPLTFISLGFLLQLVKEKVKKNNFIFWGALTIVTINFFRIDFSITFKFFIIVYSFAYFFIKYATNFEIETKS